MSKIRSITAFVLALSIALICAAAHAVPVNVAKPVRDPKKLAATVAGSGLDASITMVQVNPDGSATIQLAYKNAAGRIFTQRSLNVPLLRSSPITDNSGVTVNAIVPAALGNAIDAFNAQLSSMLATAAAAAKLDL